MASVDSRKWAQALESAKVLVPRAIALQGREAGIDLPTEAARLWSLYDLQNKPPLWREFGAIAVHLSAEYKPDLAYGLIYTFREQRERPDPVPLVMTALQNLWYFNVATVGLHLKPTPEIAEVCSSPRQLALRGGRILAREISVAPYEYATGIYASWDSTVKPLLTEALREFNPTGATLLEKGSKVWMRTKEGFAKTILTVAYRVLFGREE